MLTHVALHVLKQTVVHSNENKFSFVTCCGGGSGGGGGGSAYKDKIESFV